MGAIAGFTFTADDHGKQRVGKQRVVTGQLVPSDDGDWQANGFALTAATFGLNRLDSVQVDGMALNGTGGALASLAGWDKAAGALMAFEAAADDAEFDESNLTAMSGYIFRVTAKGA
jgi:hypothetical protein